VVFFEHYDEEMVWGFTGRLTLEFLERIGVREKDS